MNKRIIICAIVFITALLLFSCKEEQPASANTDGVIDETVAEKQPIESIQQNDTEPLEEDVIAPEPNPKNDDYFDGALFIGDSIMEGIRQYVARERKSGTVLGDARFVTTTIGISLADLTGHRDEGIYFSYKGKEQTVEEILMSADAKRVFFLLGLNDLAAGFDNQTTTDRYLELISNIKSVLPEMEIIVIANPPKVASSWLPAYVKNRDFNNELILDLVTRVKDMCEENEIEFVDIHTPLCNEKGALDDENCRDGYVHLNDAGSKTVVDTLYKFAEYK